MDSPVWTTYRQCMCLLACMAKVQSHRGMHMQRASVGSECLVADWLPLNITHKALALGLELSQLSLVPSTFFLHIHC